MGSPRDVEDFLPQLGSWLLAKEGSLLPHWLNFFSYSDSIRDSGIGDFEHAKQTMTVESDDS